MMSIISMRGVTRFMVNCAAFCGAMRFIISRGVGPVEIHINSIIGVEHRSVYIIPGGEMAVSNDTTNKLNSAVGICNVAGTKRRHHVTCATPVLYSVTPDINLICIYSI